ncbi:MAG: phage terminase large subunit [Halobacteriota archaeon]
MIKKQKPVFGPCSLKQQLILQDNTTDVILMGGGAGGGKSRICLTKNLDGIKDKDFRCVILRRYEPELKRPGGLIDESKQVYSHFTKVPYKTQAKVWQFPSGAEISFSAISCDDDLGSWQGSQLTRIMVDEAGDKWTEKQVLFLQSRMRTASSKIHTQLILTCNPDINSFLKGWVDFCLDPITGVPVEGTEDRIRWFCVEDNKAKWADSPEECYELYGREKGLIYAHRMTEEQMSALTKDEQRRLFMPKSFRFVPTNVFDNPYLLPPKNNSYLASLLSQPYVNQLKFLHGSWTAREEGSMYFNRAWTPVVDFPPVNPMSRVRAWDFASEEKTKTNNPDWTAGVKMSRDKFGTYYIEDVLRIQATTDKVLKTVAQTAHSDGVEDCTVCIPLDPAASGKTAAYFYRTTLAEDGIPVKMAPTTAGKGKLTRFLPFCSLAEAGAVRIVKGDWNEDFFKELESFSGDLKIQKHQKDDMVDATADAFTQLAKQVTIPVMYIPSMTMPSVMPTI